MKRTPLRRKKALKRGGGLKPMSAKRKANSAEYYRLRDIYLSEHPTCEVDRCAKQGTDIHHKAGRIGKNYLDVSRWMACCRYHHRKIHDNPAWAVERGYLIPFHLH